LSIAVCVLSTVDVETYSAGDIVYVKETRENVRKTPSGQRFDELLRGAELRVIEDNGAWVKFRATGWI
jgi:hypothetical protein